ncbi:hypothetical protein [Nocardioides houyundeii]|uniref:hypothetical protein n=1 Tax=Nocardioides houyundeii TaxID=2045452 RepID=UPI000DF15084|nr:hypothetical protein [Nocardioides houyundeii]
MTDLEHDLSTSLHDRAEAVPAAPLTFDGVRGRARRIRRKRQGLVAAGLAAVVAVVVPTALLFAPRSSDDAPSPATPPTGQVIPDHALAGNQTLDVTGLPLGTRPLVGYLDLTGDRPVAVSADGDEVALTTDGRPLSWTRLGDGRYVVETTEQGAISVEVLAATGALEGSYPATGSLVVDQDHRQVAWPEGPAVMVLQSGAERPRPLGSVADAQEIRLVDLTGSDCFAELVPGAPSGGCTAFGTVTRPDGASEGWLVGTGGDDAASSEGHFRSLADWVDAGDPQETSWVSYQAGIREVREDLSTCSGIFGVDERSRQSRWLIETCEHRFDSFSPDHGSLLAWESYGDGVGHYEIAMYDMETRSLRWSRSATGPGMAHVSSAAWEDDDHVLAPAYQDGQWLLVRFGPDGAMERVTEPAPGEDVEPAYLPETQH